MSVNSATFCASPWTTVRIHSDGSINFCDYAKQIDTLDEENISSISVDEYFSQSFNATSARNLILVGENHKRCNHCIQEESIVFNGQRLRNNLKAGIFPGNDFTQSYCESNLIKEINSGSGSKPKFYHVSFSNACNMACVMCKPVHSTKVAKDWKSAGLIASSRGLAQWAVGETWNKFLDHLLSNDQIHCLHIMGGEPLYHPQFKKLLQFLVDNDHTNFNFTFVTNASIYDVDLVNLLKKFNSVQIEVSVETFAKSNDYIRWLSNTPKIKQNIISWLSHRAENFDVILRTVPQLFSVFDYYTILDFALEYSVTIDSNLIKDPGFLHPKQLPENEKNKTIQVLQKYVDGSVVDNIRNINIRDNSRIQECVASNAQTVINLLKADKSNDLTNEMISYIKKLDTVRNIDVRNYIPEISEWITSLGYDNI